VLIAMNFYIAWQIDGLPKAVQPDVIGYHKAWGMLILALSVLRLVWRFTHPVPPLLESLRSWEAALAKVTHWLFYVAMIAMPLAGWIMHSAATGGLPVSFFGLFDFPGLPLARSKEVGGLFFDIHGMIGTLMLALAALHVLASLKHIAIDRDGTMRRMLPWG
jgi:cytochrome b561